MSEDKNNNDSQSEGKYIYTSIPNEEDMPSEEEPNSDNNTINRYINEASGFLGIYYDPKLKGDTSDHYHQASNILHNYLKLKGYSKSELVLICSIVRINAKIKFHETPKAPTTPSKLQMAAMKLIEDLSDYFNSWIEHYEIDPKFVRLAEKFNIAHQWAVSNTFVNHEGQWSKSLKSLAAYIHLLQELNIISNKPRNEDVAKHFAEFYQTDSITEYIGRPKKVATEKSKFEKLKILLLNPRHSED